MNKKTFFSWITCAVILSVGLNIFFGRFLTAKISTLPLLNSFKILTPQAPIVINNHEVVKVEGGEDFIDLANNAKSKVVLLISGSGQDSKVIGFGVSVTTDGLVLAPASVISKSTKIDSIVFNDGQVFPVSSITIDKELAIAFVKSTATKVAAVEFGDSQNVQVGERIAFVQNSYTPNTTRIFSSIVTREQNDSYGIVYDSAKSSRVFGFQHFGDISSGSVAFNLKGQAVGFWNGDTLISSDVIRQSMSLYISGVGKISRPDFQFSFSEINKSESGVKNLSVGAFVIAAVKVKNGLSSGDIITEVDGVAVRSAVGLEELLEKYKPGNEAHIKIWRNGEVLTVSLAAQ